jgi:hypothetical protein
VPLTPTIVLWWLVVVKASDCDACGVQCVVWCLVFFCFFGVSYCLFVLRGMSTFTLAVMIKQTLPP